MKYEKLKLRFGKIESDRQIDRLIDRWIDRWIER